MGLFAMNVSLIMLKQLPHHAEATSCPDRFHGCCVDREHGEQLRNPSADSNPNPLATMTSVSRTYLAFNISSKENHGKISEIRNPTDLNL